MSNSVISDPDELIEKLLNLQNLGYVFRGQANAIMKGVCIMVKIKKWFAYTLLLLGNPIIGFAMTPSEAKAFYKEAFEHTVLNLHSTKKDYANYFSKYFVMQMNGKAYHFDEYVQFMFDINKDTQSVDINFKDMIAESNQVATSHITHVIKKNGKEFYFDVLSQFKIQDHKFISAKELSKLQS